jgi:dihydrofolate synthase/folylpolyglutamate synthase
MGFDAEAYFNDLNMNGIRLGLEATRELAARCGNPERNLKFIHLAGTNGKGSTGAMLECALRHAGLKTGFYTSPHLVYLRERFRIAGRAVPQERFVRAAAELAELAKGGSFSYFETATVLAMKLFAEEKCDVVVWETGMGGRLDATNVVTPVASIITNIAFDHMHALGNTLSAIATEKAGIVKPGVPVFLGVMPDEARNAIAARAAELDSPLVGPGEAEPATAELKKFPDGRVRQCFTYAGRQIELPLLGRMQRRNFRIVFAVLRELAPRLGFDFAAALAGVRDTRWPARFQEFGDRLLVDGAHNPDGIAALLEALDEVLPGKKLPVIYAAFKDKHVEHCLPELAKKASRFYFTPLALEGRASFSGDELGAMLKNWSGVPFTPCSGAAEALRRAQEENPNSTVLSAGSLYLAGEILTLAAPPEAVLDLV